MIFVDDLAAARAWLAPAPIGIVEPGWAAVVGEVLDDVGRALAGSPGGTVDMLDLSERDGSLRCVLVLDGENDATVAVAVEAAVEVARRRAAATCYRCGAPGRLRLDRAGWPATRCDAHAFGTRPS